MTILFPDVSQYTPNVDVTPYPVVLARATLSASVADTSYSAYKQRSAGKVFVAYHWLNHGNLTAQAAWCFQHVGTGVPVMIDAEDVAGNTSYAGPLTVGDITGFASAYRALGGIVSLVYLPAWYFFGPMGAPDLTPLTAAGLHLVSSNYPPAGYTDNGPGWAPYGGVAPVQWQYTSTPVDMNAYRGTVDDYRRLVGGQPQEDDMTVLLTIVRPDGSARSGPTDGLGNFHWIPDAAALQEFQRTTGLQIDTISEDMARRAYGIVLDPPAPPPTPVTMTAADQQAIAALVAAQIGGKVDALTALLTHVEQQLAAAGHALES